MTRVIHTGDTHIGYRQYHSPERRRDFLAAFEAVVDDAVADDVDAVVHAGDLFHDRRPDLDDVLGTIAALRRLDDASIPFLAVVGNHESTRGAQWLDLFERLGLATRLGSAPHRVGDVAFYGLDHVPQSRRDALEYDYDPHDADYAVLVAHGLFTPFAHADWDTETVLDESSVAFDAMLLGDNHTPDTADVDGTWVTYCGSTERASASERDGRGYNIVEFGASRDGGVSIRRRSLDTRPFEFVEVELHEGEGGDRVREQVRQRDLEGAVAVVELTGEGDSVPPASVEEAAAAEGALVTRVTDRRDHDEEAAATTVNFADPDEAVRERIAGLGLSGAALDVDETIRASKTADSNVRDVVRDGVADLVEAGDLDAFDPAETPDDGASSDNEASADDPDAPTDEPTDAPAETDAETGGDTPADAGVTPADVEGVVAGDESADSPPADDGGGGESAGDSDGAVDGRDESTVGDAENGVTDDSDGQTSMEEYL